MKIGVVSDSHGNLYMLEKAISLMGEIDMLIHLGDSCRDIIKLKDVLKLNIEYVYGNNEYNRDGIWDKIIIVEGRRILLTHGHNHRVSRGLDNLYFKGLEEGVEAVLYGHTHRQNVERYGDIIFINPGSIALPRDIRPGYAILEVDNKGIDVRLFRFSAY